MFNMIDEKLAIKYGYKWAILGWDFLDPVLLHLYMGPKLYLTNLFIESVCSIRSAIFILRSNGNLGWV